MGGFSKLFKLVLLINDMIDPRFRLKNPVEFMEGATFCSVGRDFKRVLDEGIVDVDLVGLREEENWSYLAGKVVGAERDYQSL